MFSFLLLNLKIRTVLRITKGCPPCGNTAVQRCGRHGCYNGYCWSECLGISNFPFPGNDWCYTTQGRSQDFNYVECTNDEECCESWSCAGSCTWSNNGPI